jgi:hypothetical protein
MLAFGNITAPYDDPWYHEIIFVSSGRVLYLCLIRTSESEDPFINAIELRTLQDDMYRQAKPGTSLHKYARIDFGGKSTVRLANSSVQHIHRLCRGRTNTKLKRRATTGIPY